MSWTANGWSTKWPFPSFSNNKGYCSIAIDIAANNFSNKINIDSFEYIVDNKTYTTESLIDYYTHLLKIYPNIIYLEDPLHEDDVNGWKKIFDKLGNKILIVSDDLTASKVENLQKYEYCFNACILKINQAGNLSELLKSYDYCITNNIQIIISQRSGETDSNIIAHIVTGLSGDYLKAGAPARERIIKYNELLRITN